MATVCRLCGNNEGHAIFIFGNEALKHHIDLKIRAGLDIQIFPDDPLPKHACIGCLGKLDEFWTFLHQCRRVQTKLRRLLPERIPFQFENINSNQRQNSEASTEECSARIEVLETFGDSTDNDCNNPGGLYSIINGKSEKCTVKFEPHASENSNDSFHSYNESCGNECEPCVNDPYFIDTDLLVTTQNGTSLAAGELDSCCQGSKENMAISGAVLNTLQPSLLNGEVACKTTIPATDTCSQDVPVHEVHYAEVTQGDGVDSSKVSLIFIDQPLNHPNHVRSETTNVSSGIEAGKLTRNTEFDLGGLSITGDSQPLQVIHSGADMADMSEQDMEISGIVSDLIETVAVGIENDVRRNLQLNTSSRSDSNPSHENKEHSIIVNSGSNATCVHGIDASMCIYKQCCDSHPLDKYWKKVGSRFYCVLCDYVTFGGRYKLRKHISAHVSLNVFECSVCNKKLRSYQSLNSHMKIHSRKDDESSTKVCGVYSCENCSKSFKYKRRLRDHQIKRCGIGSVSCPGCGLPFSSLKRHKYNCPGKTGFVCDICNKSCKVKKELVKHIRTHEQGEYACDKCDKIYSKLYLLRNHQNAVHGTGKYKCTHCTKTFHDTFNLEQHVAGHTRIRNYLCEICSKSFLYASNLATHLKFHGKRDIKCHLCGKMYFRKNMLLSHMKNVHCK